MIRCPDDLRGRPKHCADAAEVPLFFHNPALITGLSIKSFILQLQNIAQHGML
jgi:hypothetical protein